MRLVEESLSLHRQSQDIPIKKQAVTPRKKALALGRAVLPLFVCYEIGVCNFMNRSGAFFIPRSTYQSLDKTSDAICLHSLRYNCSSLYSAR